MWFVIVVWLFVWLDIAISYLCCFVVCFGFAVGFGVEIYILNSVVLVLLWYDLFLFIAV